MLRGFRQVSLLLAILMPSCASAQAEPTAASPLPAAPEPIALDLNHGEAKRVAGTPLTITFEAVTDDSRCPEGVSCIWAGDAVVHIRVEGGTAPVSTATLHVNARFERDVVHGDHRVTLVALAPYPKADAKIEAKDYRITLRIDSISPRGAGQNDAALADDDHLQAIARARLLADVVAVHDGELRRTHETTVTRRD